MRIFRSACYIFFPLLALFSFRGCKDSCKGTTTYIYYRPVYTTPGDIRAGVQYVTPREIKVPGKIYFKDGYLFINEKGKGIHVIDNHDPATPTPIGFLKIPGNNDLAIQDDFLYADSFIDLVVFDISDKNSIHEVNRVERVFIHGQANGFPILSGDLILTDWKKVSTIELDESECEMTSQRRYYEDGILYSVVKTSGAGPASISSDRTVGIGGSMATFTITQNNLYALDGAWLNVISLNNPQSPSSSKSVQISSDVETLFPYKDKLFIGSRNGMFIYDIQSDTPQRVGYYGHMMSCDPVVVDDNYAYVTLRTGKTCKGTINQLEVINISDLAAPSLVKVYPMTNPYGLGIENKVLFVCDGTDGLKVYDAADVLTIDNHKLAQYATIKALDIIPYGSIAMMIAADGLHQYNYEDPKNIFLVSKLPITK